MSDPVHNPPHYKSGGIEAIDVIEAFELGFNLGNVLKYVLRSGRKGDALTDLRKAKYYIDREIARREAGADESKKQVNSVEVDVTTRDDLSRRMAKVFFDTPIPTTGNVVVSEVASEKQECDG